MWFNGKSLFNALHMKIHFILSLHFRLVSLDFSAVIHDFRSKSHITQSKCTLIGPIDSTELNLQVTKVTLKENFGRERKCENLPCCRCEKMKKTNPNLSEVECGTQFPDDFPRVNHFREKCSDHEAPLNKGHEDWKNQPFVEGWKSPLQRDWESWWRKFSQLTTPACSFSPQALKSEGISRISRRSFRNIFLPIPSLYHLLNLLLNLFDFYALFMCFSLTFRVLCLAGSSSFWSGVLRCWWKSHFLCTQHCECRKGLRNDAFCLLSFYFTTRN